jgi:lipoyl(octanoyl) transferase
MKSISQPAVQWLGRVVYESAWVTQESCVKEALAGNEVLLLLEHEPVYTIGRTRDVSSLRDIASLPHPVIETNRGGQGTFHGPGQLVGYPILNLGNRGRDLHVYLRFLEEVLIQACTEFGVTATRREGLTGVWVQDRKIASLGVGLRKWVTMHGFAINICNPLEEFQHITPCGIQNVQMTSLEHETGTMHSVQSVARVVQSHFLELLPALLPRS